MPIMIMPSTQCLRILAARWLCLTCALATGMVAAAERPEIDASALAVIAFDLAGIDQNGLIGPEDGKRAVDYEYCIPNDSNAAAEVRAIDPSARIMAGSRGRIGCMSEQLLVLGNTHQPGFRRVLHRLAELPYVQRIEQAFFE
jgi:hypothetical protein